MVFCLFVLKHQTCLRELSEKVREDPAYIQELRWFTPAELSNAKFDQEQLSNILQMFQRLQNNANLHTKNSFW